jgi:hypothetical protein
MKTTNTEVERLRKAYLKEPHNYDLWMIYGDACEEAGVLIEEEFDTSPLEPPIGYVIWGSQVTWWEYFRTSIACFLLGFVVRPYQTQKFFKPWNWLIWAICNRIAG